MPTIDFWYEFASTYSYLAAMRIEREAGRFGVAVRWRPFLLGPVFASQGWSTSPFNLFPAKGEYMWRDLARHAEALGLKLGRPAPFPQNGLLAARVALVGHAEGWGEAFAKAVYAAEFADLQQISEPEVVADILAGLRQDPHDVLARALGDSNKSRLRDETDEAIRLGIFGAPTFVTEDGELFWGNDRLVEALCWAREGSLKGLMPPYD
jgi:2-hydroxychromene-2-carboxylate isomerase